jgi:hypothetical protein
MARVLTAGLLALAVLIGSTPGFAQDTIATRLTAAERYAAVADLEAMLRGAIPEVAASFPPDQRAAFIAFMTRSVDAARFRTLALNSMVQVFTTDELNALADFYGSPTGRAILKKFPQYMGVVMPLIRTELARAAQGFKP